MKINSDESQNIEFKESWNDKYLQWICGFANAQGGKIYIGVNDDHEVVGVADSKKLLEDVPNKVAMYLGIVVDVNLFQTDGLDYIEISVDPCSVPINYRGHYHYRSGSTKQELTGVALQQFILRKMGKAWDDVYHDSATIEAIDRGAIDYFLKMGIVSGRIDEADRQMSTQNVLENLDLIDDTGKLKNAALLLFAKRPQKFFTGVEFQIGKFGKDEGDLQEMDIIDGNIIEMADKVLKVLKFKYLHSPIHFEGMQRIERLEVPDKAFREILYNAIAHKDYTGPNIQMHVYDDRIEIWNEGSLPEDFTAETLMQQHPSKPRNRNIAFAFFKAGFIDRWGLGYKKICEGFKAEGLPIPTISLENGGVKVTVWRKKDVIENVLENGENVIENVLINDVSVLINETEKIKEILLNLTEKQRSIYDKLKESGEVRVLKDVLIKDVPVLENVLINKDNVIENKNLVVINVVESAKSLAERLGVSERTIRRDLAALQSLNIVCHKGSRKNGYWEVSVIN